MNMETKPRFEVTYLEEAFVFLNSLDIKVRSKIQLNIIKAQHDNDPELFKKLNESIWEFRTRYNGISYRLFAFWDKTTRSMVIATHGLIKKTQKTPSKEIAHAEAIMKKYYQSNK